ncbi:hypothetical protein DFH07DRAFT_811357 [Mycena maculata]|uniref:Uncharacterized protein n=1 Tax=Mycena maculata TaxID=230809 RepID=A0AAD7JIE9_9AGAR|nr:hypothetical protein DFH07DRAFT_811357 [Mycena maculata]
MASSLWVGVSTLWVSTFLYGIYLVLFCRCMYIFYRGKRQTTLLISAIVMFLLSTTTVIISLLQGATAYGNNTGGAAAIERQIDRLEVAGAIVYVTNNVIADALLIYRCYVIWNTIWITVVPLILLVTTLVLGYMIQLPLFFILSLTVNLFVPTLVAGRLWWIVRRIRGPAGEITRRKGRNAMIIILESGLIYSLLVSIHMGFFHSQNPMDEIVYAALGQVVGIVPTLIIVRVGLGVSENGGMSVSNSASPQSMQPHLESQGTIVVGRQSTEKSGWDADTIV